MKQTLETCRQVYNSFLLWRIVSWETEQKSVGYHDQAIALPVWKQEHPELSDVSSQVLQNVAVRVDLAFKAFFRRCRAEAPSSADREKPGFPRFKGEGYDSFTYPQSGFSLGERSVTLSKIGDIKAVVHRRLEGRIKTCTIRRQAGKWFACFSVEVEPEPRAESAEQVGLDVGLEKFAALSDGTFIANPRFFRREEKALAKAQCKLAECGSAAPSKHKIGSQKRRKAKKVVRRIHERIRNRRHDFVHQTARRLVNRFGLIAVEKLSVKGLSKRPKPLQDEQTGEYLPNGASAKSGLNKSIQDAAWSQFRFVLAYKAESAGRVLAEVNPAYTSQDCFGCGYRAKKPLKERWHFCPNCGLSLDRDVNAAKNILKIAVGLHSVPA